MKLVAETGGACLHRSLKRQLEGALIPLIKGHERHICLVDPPGHSNVGDQAILLGELDFLRAHFPRSKLSFFDIDNYSVDCDRFIEKCSIILMHGGGNFGDIWPPHHQLRLSILRRFPHKRIVQLPQSISFSSAESLAVTAAVIAGHSDFHLIARDLASAALARSSFDCPTLLAPDMAFCLDRLERAPPVADFFCLLRTDKEVAADHRAVLDVLAGVSASVEATDWIAEPRDRLKRLDRTLSRHAKARPRSVWPINRAMLQVRERYARQRLAVGTAMLSRGQIVVTDRLHAHILSSLLGIPHFLFNSVDGKVAAFHAAWTHRDPNARKVDTIEQFGRQLRQAA
jgi:exopolysaccharide biosynthesis predicted pyruvyltransferase EpsI